MFGELGVEVFCSVNHWSIYSAFKFVFNLWFFISGENGFVGKRLQTNDRRTGPTRVPVGDVVLPRRPGLEVQRVQQAS